jgi:hypothetical protein
VISGFGDGPAVGLEHDVVRLRSAAHAGVEYVQAFELGGGELEVEHVEVLGDPWLRDAIGNRLALGLVLHTGPRSFRLDESIAALPICALWG